MNIDEMIRMILDFQERPIPPIIPRTLEITQISHCAMVISGARRVGKTWRTFQFISETFNNDSITNVCRIQFNDNRLIDLTATSLNIIDEAYYQIFPEKYNREKIYFIFDEIHRIDGWENYILRLLDNPFHAVLITGSTSKLLSGNISSALRGKIVPHNLFPLSFSEYLRFKNISIDFSKKRRSTAWLLQIKNAFHEYLLRGGFPGLLELPVAKHIEMLQSYWNTMILRDILEAHPDDRINVTVFMNFATRLISRISCPMNVRPLVSEIVNAGLKVSPDTVYKYLRYLEEAYMIYTVSIYSKSQRIIDMNYKKVYSIDWALANSVCPGEGITASRALENCMFLFLKKRYREVSYYKTAQGYEVDFIVHNKTGDKIEMYQVAYTLSDEKTREREIRALADACTYLKCSECTIVTCMEEEPDIVIPNGRIRIVPAWKLMLEEGM